MPKTASKRAPKTKAEAKLGNLPEWNLNDLYAGMDDPALQRDLAAGDAECAAFEGAFRGKLADLAAGGGKALAEAVKRYEAIEDRLRGPPLYFSPASARSPTPPRGPQA